MQHQLHHKLAYFLKQELTEIYVAHAIHSFAFSMISIFIPIFLLKEGFSLLQIAAFYITVNLVVMTQVHRFLKFAAKKGVKHSIAISVPLTVLFFLALYNIDIILPILGKFPTAIALGALNMVAVMFYWMGFHIDFAKVHTKEKSAKQFSVLQTITIILSIAGPLLGALIILWSSFNTLFLIIILLLVIGVVPLFFSGEMHEPVAINFKDIFSKRERRRHIPYIGEGMHFRAASIYWPIVLFLLAINLQEIGILYTFTNFLLALFTVYLGRVSNQKNQHHILRWGTIVHSMSLAARTAVKTLGMIAIAQGFGALSWGMINIPFFAMHYNKSQKQGVVHTIYAREIYLHIGQLISILLLVLLLSIGVPTTTALISMILTGAVAVFLMTFIKEK